MAEQRWEAPPLPRILLFMLLLLPVSLLTGPVSGILDPVDFLALQAVRKSLDDMPGSSFFAGWDFTADPCGFPGVFCSGDRVSALALGDPRAGSPGLTGRIDEAIGKLSALSELSLVPGRVAGPIPDSISLCSNLRFLALSKNFLVGTIPPSLSALSNLRTLDLSFNQLYGPVPPAVVSFPSLTNLILCHNNLTGSIPEFPSSSQLLRLDLKHNSFSGALPSLPMSLNYLSVGANKLSGHVDTVLPKLSRLNYLDLSTNQFDGPIPATVFTFPLSVLQLQRNMFSGPVTVESQVKIGLVDLSYNRLGGDVSPMFTGVGQLYLNNNRFSGEIPAQLLQELMGPAGRLQVLYLQHNFLTGMAVTPTSAAAIPAGASLCLQYNCMVSPVDTPCPFKAGMQKTRPADQCPAWRN